ncbi:zinc-binding dehydrogenase [Novosphingobium sediminicola]|uniref:NADPH:quinone reductase-like Zn-dependent oxidoreductase n=1 Tax=Novosphingobium sediminicola TaxID=563162 RepID=A0A7W6CP03_9SPHN|nr:zinc-binding dehydrogenase [Novosphingobium sediminicola]MBB3957290.1 NADPH:quinone reductase-like Zn-dependent oxidoreductase [Novosphingobium sediminicola]
MLPSTTRSLVTTLYDDARMVVELADLPLPAPGPDEVVVQVEAAPINPSDLGLMFGPALTAQASYEEGRVSAPVPPAAMKALANRIGQQLGIGNEGAGLVVAAGSGAQALVGRRVAAFAGAMYSQYRVIPAAGCMVLPEGVSAREGAAAFVNPLTALGFIETMRADGMSAMVHTAAASNLGQMLVKLCRADGIPLVNIVRSPDQVALLRSIGARHVLDSTSPAFPDELAQALSETGARVVFDAIGGGPLLGTILTTMEKVANADGAYSRYGSTQAKRGYVYGALDMAPITLPRTLGFVWDVSGWLLAPMMERLGPEARARMHGRVATELTTTFACHYKGELSLADALSREAVEDYTRRATGSKFLILPSAPL